jgi:hypothetical protein
MKKACGVYGYVGVINTDNAGKVSQEINCGIAQIRPFVPGMLPPVGEISAAEIQKLAARIET